MDSDRYFRLRFSADIISHAVWLYFRFTLRLFRCGRHLLSRADYLVVRAQAFQMW